MISHDLESLFEQRGVKRNGALLLDESNATALIDEAQRCQIAILGVDQCRSYNSDTYVRLDGKPIDYVPLRAESWNRARDRQDARWFTGSWTHTFDRCSHAREAP